MGGNRVQNLRNLFQYFHETRRCRTANLVRVQNVNPVVLNRRQVPEKVWINYTQGTFDKTDNTFDVALNGSGFFRVRDNAGNVFYTRNGNFHQDPNGFLVNNSGMNILSDAGNVLRINGNDFEIMGNGEIFVDGEYIDTIGLSEFDRDDYPELKSIGNGLFDKPAAINEIRRDPATLILQGFLEAANVEPVQTMVDMIQVFREFELGQKAIQIQDQSLQRVVTEVGTIR